MEKLDKDGNILVKSLCEPLVVPGLYLDPAYPTFFAVIPDISKVSVQTICCYNISMTDVSKKFHEHGLALQACMQFDGVFDPRYGYAVIDDHHLRGLIGYDQGNSYQRKGMNVQFIEGSWMYRDGKPVKDRDMLMGVRLNGKKIDGSEVVLDRDNLEIVVRGVRYDYYNRDETGLELVHEYAFDLTCYLVLGFDIKGQMFILYRRYIDYFDVCAILKHIECKDAIIICNGKSTRLIWKKHGEFDRYNNIQFIKNPDKAVTNIVMFS